MQVDFADQILIVHRHVAVQFFSGFGLGYDFRLTGSDDQMQGFPLYLNSGW